MTRRLPNQYLTNPGSGHTFVYVSTIQRMAINLFGRERAFPLEGDSETEDDGETGPGDIPIHAFDVVIADECHRGFTAAEQSIWRNVNDNSATLNVLR